MRIPLVPSGRTWRSNDPATDSGRSQHPCRVALIVTRGLLAALLVPGAATGASGRAAVPEDRVRVLIAGDIAGCSWEEDTQTADLIAGRSGIVMTAGDDAYQVGSTSDFRDCYDPTWGRFRGRTRPVPGNHEYATGNADAYFAYFGWRAGPAGRGYYAFNAGRWRIYALNSDCSQVGGCEPGSAQHEWLERDLAAHPTRCVMAVFHYPLITSDGRGPHTAQLPLVERLYRAGAEIIVNGHDHFYERFAPARPDGTIDREHGFRQFIVGTGGAPLYDFGPVRPAHSRRRQNRTHGVLRLTLDPGRYAWRFLPTEAGTFEDTGQGRCHGAPG